MTKYEILVQVLDRLRSEAPTTFKSYHPESEDIDGVNAARSKAFIHLFLKVRFGLLSFDDREIYITEGTNDGGIDAYYIDTQTRTIFFVQSKFRKTKPTPAVSESRTPDIGELKMSAFSSQRLADGVAHSQRSEEHTSELQSRQYLVC